MASAVVAAPVAPVAHADNPDDWFVNRVVNTYGHSNFATAAGARAAIPLAHKICDVRAKSDDFGAASAAYNAHIIDTLGISAGDIIGLEQITLGILEFAEEAYCPRSASIWGPGIQYWR